MSWNRPDSYQLDESVVMRDCRGVLLWPGAHVVVYDYEAPGIVVGFTPEDADYDDDLGRGVRYPAAVIVRWPNGTVERLGAYGEAEFPSGHVACWCCEDLVLATLEVVQ